MLGAVRLLSIGTMYPPHDLGGGYELTWRSSVLDLRERGHEVRVLASDYRSPGLPADEELDADVHRELRWYWRDHEFPRISVRDRIELERHNSRVLDRHLRESRPDAVVWWQMGGMSISLVERVRRAGLPAVGVVGDEWLRWGPRVDAWLKHLYGRPRLAGLAEKATGLPARVDLDAAAHWLFNSELVRDKARAGGLRLPRADVVNPGIDPKLFRPHPDHDWRWRLLYLGRLDPRKGIDVAIEALAHLPEAATLRVQGGGGEPEYVRSLHALAERLGLARRIEFSTAARADVPAIYAAADAVLFPVQWDEPWGLVPLEAMAVGRPVVATGAGGSREYLAHDDNCLIFTPPSSATALADAVRRLAADEKLRGRLRAAGRETATKYTEAAYNDAIAAALGSAADQARTH
jgi:glycogen synthase